MARRKSKINYSGSLADYKISMMAASADSDAPVVPDIRPRARDVFTDPEYDGMHMGTSQPTVDYYSAATTNYKPADRYPNPNRPPQKPVDRYPDPGRPPQKPADRYPDPNFIYPKPVDRYPDPLRPGQLPQKPVDRYPEATPAKPVTPKKPKKPKTKGGKSGGGDSTTGAL